MNLSYRFVLCRAVGELALAGGSLIIWPSPQTLNVAGMPVISPQEAQDWLGLTTLDSLAKSLMQRAEQHVCDFLGWEFICQQTIQEFLPLDQATPFIQDPVYTVNSGYNRAVPANYYSANVLQLRHVPLRPQANNITVYEDWTGYFGQMPGSFAAPALEFGVDYFLKVEEPAQNGNLPLCWSGQLVRRTFWWPNIPGSIKISYVAGFSDGELAGRYSVFKTACLETLADLYLRAKAVGLGHFSDIKSESDGGGVSVTYADKVLAVEIPDSAALALDKYRYCGEMAL